MINCVRLMPSWDQTVFDHIMKRAQTQALELVPSMILGNDWDCLLNSTADLPANLAEILNRYIITSIQSLTFGLNLNLADPTLNLDNRLQALCLLGKATHCSLFVLGSPSQKKIDSSIGSIEQHSSLFAANCANMASRLSGHGILALEHNTLQQGAEYCNTLIEISNTVQAVKEMGVSNVGINLDTKCLIQELGEDFSLQGVLQNPEICDHIVSIQVSHDFLGRSAPNHAVDLYSLMQFIDQRKVSVSLEEFGLLDDGLDPFVIKWREATKLFFA